MVFCAQATRFRERGASDTVLLKIVTGGGDAFVSRKCEDFFWLCEQISLLYPGVVLPSPPCADGIQFPSQRSGEMGAYLERCRCAADRFVKRISLRPEIAGAESVVAFLYAADSTFHREKARMEAEALDGAPVKLKKSELAFGRRVGWMKRISYQTAEMTGSNQQQQQQQSKSRPDLLKKLAAIEELKTTSGTATTASTFSEDFTSAEDMLGAADAEMERQLREQATVTDSSEAQKILDDALQREAEREERCELGRKRSAALGAALARRADALAKAGAAVKALSRADADATAASVLRLLGDRMLEEEQSVDDEATRRFGRTIADALDDARLSARACSIALRQRASVAAAVGDANGQSARAKTKHARCEAALAAARERRSQAVEASRRDAESARRVSDAFASEPSSVPVVDALPPTSNTDRRASQTRAVRLEGGSSRLSVDAESPLALALERRESTPMSRAKHAVDVTCAPVRRLPDTLDCGAPVARAAETLTCGFVAKETKTGLGGKIIEIEQALTLAESQAAEARAEAAAAANAQAAAEQALLVATRRVASELTHAHATCAKDLATDLRDAIREIINRHRSQRKAWQEVRRILDPQVPEEAATPKPLKPRQKQDDRLMQVANARPTFDTPPVKGAAYNRTSSVTSTSDATTSWYDLVADTTPPGYVK